MVASGLTSTPATMTPSYQMDGDQKDYHLGLARRQAELLNLQIMDHYVNLMKLDGPLVFNPRSERDWDLFFAKLEERFLIVGVLPEFKIHLTRRYLRDENLRKWVDLCNSTQPEPKYESVRDRLYQASFPNSDLWDAVLKVIVGPWVDAPPDTPNSDAADPSAAQTQTGDNKGAGVPRRLLHSAAAIKNRVNLEKQNVRRVAERYGKSTPSEDVWMKWAISMMNPTHHDLLKGLGELDYCEPAFSAIKLLDKLIETENAAGNQKLRVARKYRSRTRKDAPPNSENNNARNNESNARNSATHRPTTQASHPQTDVLVH